MAVAMAGAKMADSVVFVEEAEFLSAFRIAVFTVELISI